TAAPEAKEKAGENAAPAPPAASRNPLHPLWDYATSAANAHEAARWLHDIGDAHLGRDCLIATLPDPMDSNFGYAFDQVVEAIQQAVEAAHSSGGGKRYVFDRYWLPWDLDRRKLSADEKMDPEAPTAFREEFPGTLLFRLSSRSGRTT